MEFGTGGSGRTGWSLGGTVVLSWLCSHVSPMHPSGSTHRCVAMTEAPRAERCKCGSWCRCQHMASGKRLPWPMPPFLQSFPACLCGRAGLQASTPAAPDLPPSSFTPGLKKPALTHDAFCCATGSPGTARVWWPRQRPAATGHVCFSCPACLRRVELAKPGTPLIFNPGFWLYP